MDKESYVTVYKDSINLKSRKLESYPYMYFRESVIRKDRLMHLYIEDDRLVIESLVGGFFNKNILFSCCTNTSLHKMYRNNAIDSLYIYKKKSKL